MMTRFRKLHILLSINLRDMLDYAVEHKTVVVLDKYIRRMERHQEHLQQSIDWLGESASDMQTKYYEYTEAARLQDDDYRRFEHTLRTVIDNPDIPVTVVRSKDSTLKDLADEFYEQWHLEERQQQVLLGLQESLKLRLEFTQVIHETLQAILESEDVSVTDVALLEPLYELADREAHRVDQANREARQDARQDATEDIQRRLRETRRRLRGDY